MRVLSRSTRRRLVAGLSAGALAMSMTALAALPAAAAPPSRHTIAGSQAKWLSRAKDQGAVATGTRINFGVLLKMRDSSAAQATLAQISDPSSPSYGKWLTNATFNATYAPAPADVAAVQSWLQSQGFQLTKTLQSGMYVQASGSAAQIEASFGTTLHNYTYDGASARANTTALSLPATVPAAVAGAMSGVVGLDTGSTRKKPADTLPGPPPGARYGVQPCSDYFGQKIATDKPKAYGAFQPYAVCGYVPDQLQSAYGESPLLKAGVTGRGVTVAITDAYASPTMLQDAQTYSRRHNQPTFTRGQYTEIRPSSYDFTDPTDPQGWYQEETLDVEAVHAMAPGAKVVFVSGADDSTGLDEAWAETIDNHVADVITNSWNDGIDDISMLTQSYVDFYTQFSLEAALTGITDNFSTGDDGDNTSGGTDLPSKTVGFPADEPWVTGVGGTSVEIGSKGQWLKEYGWSSSYSNLVNGSWTPAPPGTYSSGGGGGTSVLFQQPFYQRGKVPTSLSEANGTTPMRVIPDISMPGDPNTGFRVGETQEFPNGTYYAEYRIGGTSLSSPLLAGVIAVADQLAHRSLGFVNPLYYKLIGTPAVHDEIAPTSPVAQVRTNLINGVDTSDGKSFKLQTVDVQSSTLHDTPGYDNETGVGSPNGPLFFAALAFLDYLR